MWYVNPKTTVNVDNKQARFILTMWYVNSLDITKCPNRLTSFILTMWYVNTVSIVDNNNNTFNCFILTMCFKGR